MFLFFRLFFLMLCFGIYTYANASPIFQITTPSPLPLSPGETTTITYTIKNLSGINMSQMQYFPPLLTTISSQTCGSSLANNASCTVTVSFTAPQQINTFTLGPFGVCGLNGKICSVSNKVQIVAGIVTAIAGGSYLSSTVQFPLLAQSTDSGTTWNYPSSIITNLPSDYRSITSNTGGFNSTSCASSLCVASGQYTNTSNQQKSLLGISNNGGGSWSYFSNVPTDYVSAATFGSVSCSSSDLCVAVGSYNNGQTSALLAVGRSNGSVWNFVSIIPPNLGNLSSLLRTSCSGQLCVAVGQYRDNTSITKPLLTVSNDGGVTWSFITTVPANFSNAGLLRGVSCSGTLCVVGGQYTDTTLPVGVQKPLLGVSNDSGSTWNYISTLPANYSTLGFFNGISCSGTLCAAGGQYVDTPTTLPLLATSNNSGATWSYISNLPSDYSTAGVFNSTSCKGNLCIAGGRYTNNAIPARQRPLLAVSTNAGSTWSYPATIFTNLPADYLDSGVFLSVSCRNANFCIAAGRYNNGSIFKPLLAVTTDGGITWFYPASILTNLPADYVTNGIFNGANAEGVGI